MPNYKIGDVLKPIERCMCGTYYANKFSAAIRITDINSDGQYKYDILNEKGEMLDSCYNCFKDDNLTPANKTLKTLKTLNTLQVGDYVQSADGDYRRVLAVLNRSAEDALCVYVMSTYGEKDSNNMRGIASPWNVFELKKHGFSIEDPTPETVEELTIEEAEKLLGKKIKIKK